jgi:hypothetical protein
VRSDALKTLIRLRNRLYSLGLLRRDSTPEWRAAEDLVRAIDAGGVPLNAARVNQIARQLGLEVSTRASVEHTIERVRKALEYRRSHPER